MKIHSEYVVFDNTIFFVKCLISYIKITKLAIVNFNIERLFTNHNRREISYAAIDSYITMFG